MGYRDFKSGAGITAVNSNDYETGGISVGTKRH
jgi:hypothetical protein